MARAKVPPPIIIPACASVQLRFQTITRKFSIVLHASAPSTGPINTTVPETIFSGIKANAATTTWLGHIGTAVSFAGVTIKDLRSGNMPRMDSTSAAVPGTAAGVLLPLNTAIVVTARTAQSGRQFRGRSYLAGLVDAALSDSTHFVAQIGTDGVAWLNAINSVVTPALGQLVVAQKQLGAGTDKHGNPLPARMASTVPITSFAQINARVDSQRRRTGRT